MLREGRSWHGRYRTMHLHTRSHRPWHTAFSLLQYHLGLGGRGGKPGGTSSLSFKLCIEFSDGGRFRRGDINKVEEVDCGRGGKGGGVCIESELSIASLRSTRIKLEKVAALFSLWGDLGGRGGAERGVTSSAEFCRLIALSLVLVSVTDLARDFRGGITGGFGILFSKASSFSPASLTDGHEFRSENEKCGMGYKSVESSTKFKAG